MRRATEGTSNTTMSTISATSEKAMMCNETVKDTWRYTLPNNDHNLCYLWPHPWQGLLCPTQPNHSPDSGCVISITSTVWWVWTNGFVEFFRKVLQSKVGLELIRFGFRNNETDNFESWYELCFEPMSPPDITWQELLPSLLVYR